MIWTLYLQLLLMSWVFSQIWRFKKRVHSDGVNKFRHLGQTAAEGSRPPISMRQRRHSHATISASDRMLMAVQDREMQLGLHSDEESNLLADLSGGTSKFKQEQPPINGFSCKICGKIFDVADDLITETKSFLSRKEKFSCRLCGSMGNNKAKMSAHALKHLKCNDVHYCAKCVTWVGKVESTSSGVASDAPKVSDAGLGLPSFGGPIDETPEIQSKIDAKPSTSRLRMGAPNIASLVVQVTEKKESALLQWKKQIASSEKKPCDICGKTAITRTVKGNLDICSSCRIVEAKKHQKNWRIKYAVAIRHLAPSVFQGAQDRADTTEPLQYCRQCEKPIEDKRGLLNILVKEKWQKRSPAESTLSWDIMQVFYCLICGFKTTCFTKVRKHVLTHFNTYDTLYCRECQQAINEICTDTIPDAGEASLLALSKTKRDSPVLLGKASLQGIKISLSKQSGNVACGKCKKIFDHILPLLQKIIEFHLEVKGSSEKAVYRKCYYYCRVCCVKDPSKIAIENHALRHIKNGEVFCGPCQKTTKDRRCIANLVPVMVGKDLTQQKDKSPLKVTGTSYAEMQNLASFTNLTADEEISDEEAKIFQAFVLTLQNEDFGRDIEILESIISSEWSFVYTEPEAVIEEEHSSYNITPTDKDNQPHSKERNNPPPGKHTKTVTSGKTAKEITTVQV